MFIMQSVINTVTKLTWQTCTPPPGWISARSSLLRRKFPQFWSRSLRWRVSACHHHVSPVGMHSISLISQTSHTCIHLLHSLKHKETKWYKSNVCKTYLYFLNHSILQLWDWLWPWATNRDYTVYKCTKFEGLQCFPVIDCPNCVRPKYDTTYQNFEI